MFLRRSVRAVLHIASGEERDPIILNRKIQKKY